MPPTLLVRGSIEFPERLRDWIPVDWIIQEALKPLVAKTTGWNDKILVCQSGTGSGKSTVLPSAAIGVLGSRRIVVTQPQRATAEEIPYDIAKRDNKRFTMGENIGYQTGLINRAPTQMRESLLFVTTGILYMHIRTMTPQQFMNRYSAIFFDEVHRHDLVSDLLLKELKLFYKNWGGQPECPTLVLMSATMNPQEFLDYFELSPTKFVKVAGSAGGFKITENWPDVTPANTISRTVEIIKALPSGYDILVFCPTGKYMKNLKTALPDEAVIEIMSKTIQSGELKPLFKPNGSKSKRVILATNAVETGLTLPYLDAVIDTGMSLSVAFCPTYNCTTRIISPITQASATQRRGRVGRVKAGEWWPLFTKTAYENMQPLGYAEIYTGADGIQGKSILDMIKTINQPTLEKSTDDNDDSNKDSKYNVNWKIKIARPFDPATLGLIFNPTFEDWTYIYQELYQAGFITPDWNLTASGYFATQFRKLSVQQNKFMQVALYLGVPTPWILLGVAFLNLGIQITEKLGRWHWECDLLAQLETYGNWHQATARGDSINWAREWCEKYDVDYHGAMQITELFYELLFEAHACGFKCDWKLLGANPFEIPDMADRFKRALFEGYRSNVMQWNDHLDSWVVKYKNVSVQVGKGSLIRSDNKLAVANQIWFLGSGYETGAFMTYYDLATATFDLNML